ncbi:MAG: zinc ribbon domain-containing protein [bacterium]|nr:zinc ribbon domain-containing protein [bacterium]
MQKCPSCGEPVLPNAVFCESCGLQLTPAQNNESQAAGANAASADNPQPVKATAGSLRDKISLLSGATRQLKARLQNAAASKNKMPAPQPEKKKSGKLSIIISIITGLAMLGLWIWLMLKRVSTEFITSFIK